jgi:hypothetical protein
VSEISEGRWIEDARRSWHASCDQLRRHHYAYIPGVVMGIETAVTQEAWIQFAGHWNRLERDRSPDNRESRRLRRYGQVVSRNDGMLTLRPHMPCVEAGIQRHLAPLEPQFASHPVLRSLLGRLCGMLDRVAGRTAWHIELHPCRLMAPDRVRARWTADVLRRGGSDYMVALLVNHRNVTGGCITVTDACGAVLASIGLKGSMTTLIANEASAFHAATAVEQIVPGKPAWCDVLVAGFTRRDEAL